MAKKKIQIESNLVLNGKFNMNISKENDERVACGILLLFFLNA